MQIEGTRQAFEAMIQERGIYKRLGVERSTVAAWKIYLREGKNISLDKMEEMLIKAGANVLQEKVWELDSVSYEGLNENMQDFYEELRSLDVNGTIDADYSTNMDRTMVINALYRRANEFKAKILEDDTNRPIFKYTFERIQ